MPNGLTVLAALRRGEEESLRQVLRAIGDDIKGKRAVGPPARPHIDFPRSRTVHFARFAILDDPERGPDRKRLLFSSTYDGDLDGHLRDLIAITSDMQAIWGSCEAYAGVADFPAFIRAHSHQPAAFYIAYRTATAVGIQRARDARRHLQAVRESADASALTLLLADPADERAAIRIVNRVADATRWAIGVVGRLDRALPLIADVVRAVVDFGLKDVYRGTIRIIASLDRYPIFRFANWLTSNRLPPRKTAYTSVTVDNCAPWEPLAPLDEVPSPLRQGTPPTFREDAVTQNQLTLITVIDPQHVNRVRAVMAAIDSYAKRLAPPGSLIGISTIHFVRWLILDEGRRLMMVSDYDGSWESYIDEFAEMILSGLDAIWETSFGFPPDGARDLPAFKRFLRTHQVPAEVFYSAYPEATVLNVGSSLELADTLAETASGRLRGFLERL